jgi:hypothetical protein
VLEDAYLANALYTLWVENWGVHGARKLWHAARRAGLDVGRGHVARLMKVAGIHGVVRGRRTTATTMRDRGAPPQPDLGHEIAVVHVGHEVGELLSHRLGQDADARALIAREAETAGADGGGLPVIRREVAVLRLLGVGRSTRQITGGLWVRSTPSTGSKRYRWAPVVYWREIRSPVTAPYGGRAPRRGPRGWLRA